MAKRSFTIEVRGSATIEIDEDVIAAVDDEWRQDFYDLDSPEEIAAHIAYNEIVNSWGLSHLDGFANFPDSYAKVGDVDIEVTAEAD